MEGGAAAGRVVLAEAAAVVGVGCGRVAGEMCGEVVSGVLRDRCMRVG